MVVFAQRVPHSSPQGARLKSTLKVYQARKAHLPGSAGLGALVTTRILDTLPIDPWGRPYLYEQREGFVHVATLGRDGVAGGDDDDEIWMLTCEPPHEGACWLRD